MEKEIEPGEDDMRDLNYELKQLCERKRDGSHATQRDRKRGSCEVRSLLALLTLRRGAWLSGIRICTSAFRQRIPIDG